MPGADVSPEHVMHVDRSCAGVCISDQCLCVMIKGRTTWEQVVLLLIPAKWNRYDFTLKNVLWKNFNVNIRIFGGSTESKTNSFLRISEVNNQGLYLGGGRNSYKYTAWIRLALSVSVLQNSRTGLWTCNTASGLQHINWHLLQALFFQAFHFISTRMQTDN